MRILQKLKNFAQKSPGERAAMIRYHLGDWDRRVRHRGNDRTAYVIGLFGTGRNYIEDLILANLGIRAKYYRPILRLHPGPTSMIYSGHATIKHVSRDQALPSTTARIVESAGLGFADLIFIYRHPLDSLLTNWSWWRRYIKTRDPRFGCISDVYKNHGDLCVDLELSFGEFKAFADGAAAFFAAAPGPPFLSFAEFVEETELFLQCATLALRLEDFISDPQRQFCRISEVMGVPIDSNRLRVEPPITRPYRYLAVKEQVPLFAQFINELAEETKARIERIGYRL